jgi:hypothetical protein
LRAELELTHRENLEIRMAIEEAWAQMASASDEQQAQLRVEDARRNLAQHFNQLRDSINQQRHELTETQRLFETQKNEFREERQTLTLWVSERDEAIRRREEHLAQQAHELDERLQSWHQTRDRWVRERTEAEEIIRGLLLQLSAANDPLQLPPLESAVGLGGATGHRAATSAAAADGEPPDDSVDLGPQWAAAESGPPPAEAA